MTLDCHRIKLNVGGAYFETTRTTLRKLDSPVLNRLFPKRQKHQTSRVAKEKDDVTFIDRDPECFRAILNLARYDQVFLTEHVTIDMLEKEAEFLKLNEHFLTVIATFRQKKEDENKEKNQIVEDVSICREKMFESLEELREIKNSLYADVSDSELSFRLKSIGSHEESDGEPQLSWDD